MFRMPLNGRVLNVGRRDGYDQGHFEDGGPMPVAGQRDATETRSRLTGWLARQLPEAHEVEITDLVVPQATGFSN
jgi:hypothetical protein